MHDEPRAPDEVSEAWLEVSVGFEVVREDGRRVGRVAEVLLVPEQRERGLLLVRSGVLRRKLVAIPVGDVVAVAPRRERVVVKLR